MSCGWYHMVSSRSANEPLPQTQGSPGCIRCWAVSSSSISKRHWGDAGCTRTEWPATSAWSCRCLWCPPRSRHCLRSAAPGCSSRWWPPRWWRRRWRTTCSGWTRRRPGRTRGPWRSASSTWPGGRWRTGIRPWARTAWLKVLRDSERCGLQRCRSPVSPRDPTETKLCDLTLIAGPLRLLDSTKLYQMHGTGSLINDDFK